MNGAKFFDEDEVAKEVKVMYVKQRMLGILEESGLSKEEQIHLLHKMIETRYS